MAISSALPLYQKKNFSASILNSPPFIEDNRKKRSRQSFQNAEQTARNYINLLSSSAGQAGLEIPQSGMNAHWSDGVLDAYNESSNHGSTALLRAGSAALLGAE